MLIITNQRATKSMQYFFAKNIFLKDGWQSNVRFKVTDDGLISDIELNSQSTSDDTVLHGAVIPTMSNCHSHAFQRAFAGLTERASGPEDSFWSWRDMMYRFVEHLTPDDCYVIARQLYIEMLKAGYSRVGEFHYLHHDNQGNHYDDPLTMSHQVINAAESTGLRMTLLPVMYQHAGFGKQKAGDGQRRFLNTLDDYQTIVKNLRNHYPELQVGITPHSLRAVDMSDVHELHTEFGGELPFHIHIAEQQAEIEQCLSYCQQRPVAYLYDNLPVDEQWTLIHATHLSSGESQSIIDSGAIAGICPTTEANLGDGFFNKKLLLNTELNWAIGSDSHISIDPCEELRTLEYGLRLQQQRRAILADAESQSVGLRLWQSAAKGGDRSLHGNAGELSMGRDADFIVLNDEHSSLSNLPIKHYLDAIIFSSRPGDIIKDVFIAGEPVIENGRHALEETSLVEYQKVMASLMSKI